jgi:hypothetical protein
MITEAQELEPRPLDVGHGISAIHTGTTLLVGTVGMLICGVQPVVLGALVNEHRLSAAGLGWATTAEFLALGLGIIVAAATLRPRRLRLLAVLAAVATGVADLAIFSETGPIILLNRAVSGLGEALLVWITVCMVVRSARPARWSGIFLTAQGITQLIFSGVVPLTLIADRGANGGFLGLAMTAALAIAAAPFLPDRMADLPQPKHVSSRQLLAVPSLLTLLCVFLIAAFSIGLFAYLAPLAMQARLTEVQLGFVVSTVLGTSILGSALAAFLPKLPYYSIFVVCLIVNGIVVAIYFANPNYPVFLITGGVFGFFWMFFMPYQLPMAIEIDPTRQVALVLSGAQLLGGGAGPFICSLFVTDFEARGAVAVAGTCFLVAFVIATVLHFRFRRREGVHSLTAE